MSHCVEASIAVLKQNCLVVLLPQKVRRRTLHLGQYTCWALHSKYRIKANFKICCESPHVVTQSLLCSNPVWLVQTCTVTILLQMSCRCGSVVTTSTGDGQCQRSHPICTVGSLWLAAVLDSKDYIVHNSSLSENFTLPHTQKLTKVCIFWQNEQPFQKIMISQWEKPSTKLMGLKKIKNEPTKPKYILEMEVLKLLQDGHMNLAAILKCEIWWSSHNMEKEQIIFE